MSGHATNLDVKTLWGGKESPFSTSYGKLMMWFFLVSDALTFSGLLIAYGFVRAAITDPTSGVQTELWPIGEETFNSLPFLGHGYPLIYVALMTFILIVSSVTMVLAVEAGHRMDKKGVVKWMIATIVGGLFFLFSQVWEWTHFIHGSEFGKIELSDGSEAIVHGEFGEIKSFRVESVVPGSHHKKGEVIKDDLMHSFQHAAENGHIYKGGIIELHDGTRAKIDKAPDHHVELIVKKSGGKRKIGDVIEGKEAIDLYYKSLYSGTPKVTYGAKWFEDGDHWLPAKNEYGHNNMHISFSLLLGFMAFMYFLELSLTSLFFLVS
ncbi:MAG: cytochrome c oxidase subunit 3 [Crocinitomicaceae bacterium]|nr:cytochrome c oxidase subunit 3 [Crocinitomicaceae bacterium]